MSDETEDEEAPDLLLAATNELIKTYERIGAMKSHPVMGRLLERPPDDFSGDEFREM